MIRIAANAPESLKVHGGEPRFAIGHKFRRRTRGKHKPPLSTVVDIWRTYNAAGELVRLTYVAEHVGPGGQTITERDVCDTTIAMGTERGFDD